MKELDRRISEIVRSKVKGEIQAFPEDHRGSRNGYYERDPGTRYGRINDLMLPGNRDSEFQTSLFY